MLDNDEFGDEQEDANRKGPSSEMIRQMTKTRRLDLEDDENMSDRTRRYRQLVRLMTADDRLFSTSI